MTAESSLLIRIVSPNEPIDYTLLRDHATYPECGAVVTFEGVVRLTENERPLAALSYDHHVAMAEPELEKVCREALQRFDVRRVACAHRVGEVAVQEASVLVVVGADHRGAAFEACQYVIDTLKRTVPIWKSPVYADAADEKCDYANGLGRSSGYASA